MKVTSTDQTDQTDRTDQTDQTDQNGQTHHDQNGQIKLNRISKIKSWLENLENEDKRKIVSALRRSKEAANNPNSTKLRKAQEVYGALTPLSPILIKSERFGKERFALEFLPELKIQDLNNSNPDSKELWLSPNEALEIANSTPIERATYAQRLKLAFVYLGRRQGVKNFRQFRYSTDGEHYTKAYPSLDSVPQGEKTISFEDAISIVQHKQEGNATKLDSPEVFQTKVFRVSLSALESGQILAFEKCQPEESSIPRANYRVDIHPQRSYMSLKRSSNYKLLWPTKQENALFCLMDACQDLILQCSAQQLGNGDNFYATLYQRHSEIGPDGFLYKGLITSGLDKKSSSQKTTENVEAIWQGFNNKAKPIVCLHSKECHWICQLVEESYINE